LERVYKEPLGEIQFEKMVGKRVGGGGEVFIEPLGGVAIFLRSVENIWDVLGLRQGQFKTP
jgi:hypothetical protein